LAWVAVIEGNCIDSFSPLKSSTSQVALDLKGAKTRSGGGDLF